MNTKNLMSQVVKSVNRFNIQDLPIDLVELSERDIQHISGGSNPTYCACGRVITCTDPRPTGLGGGPTGLGGRKGGDPTGAPACNCQVMSTSNMLDTTVLSRFDSIFGKY
jgi:hypothetical protein